MVADFALTLAGQPSSYWKDSSTAQELNALVASAMHKGPIAIIAGWSLYAGAAFALASLLPGRLASIAAMTLTLAHFSAASGWLMYRFHLGMFGLYLFGLAVAVAMILMSRESNPANQALQTPGSGTPAASASAEPTAYRDAPVAPPPGIAGR
jgi:hypothetical protein